MAQGDSGREPVQLVEIDQDQCTLEYGVSPCQAVLGTSGNRKCFNTRSTCQDPTNYDKGTLTLRFAKAHAELPAEWGQVIPSLQSVSTTPTEINPGGGDSNRSPLGARAKLRVTFKDHPHSDFLVDKYRSERLIGTADANGDKYNPLERGTFWSKWIKRNPFYVGRAVRVREGYIEQSPEDMTTRYYIIKTVSGPDSQGKVTVTGEDILSLADIDKAQAPRATDGELYREIAAGGGVAGLRIFNHSDSSQYPQPPLGGFETVRINDEVFRYENRLILIIDGIEVIELQDITRGADGTEFQSHDIGDNVQFCLRYDRVPVWEVDQDLLENYAGVPPAFIPFSDWEEEGQVWLSSFTVKTLITEPTGVKDLIGELLGHTMHFLWWDERQQLIKLKALRPPVEGTTILDDFKNIRSDSWRFKKDDEQRVSQVWVFYDQRDPTEKLDDQTNYRRLRIRIDAGAESEDQYDERKVKRIYSRWLHTRAQAINVAAKMIARYRNGAEYLRLQLDAKDRDLWTGDVSDVTLWSQVDDTGSPEERRYQVISAEEVQPGEVVEYSMLRYEFVGRFSFIMENDAPVYADATESDLSRGCWLSDANGLMPDGSDGWDLL